MRYILILLLLSSMLMGQETEAVTAQSDTAAAIRQDSTSNAYIHEDWDYFASRLRNEYLALGEKRFRSGDYQGAVIDYFNFLYHFPEDDLIPLVHYRIALAYERLKEYQLAREQYQIVDDDPSADARVKVACMRQLARMDYELGDTEAVLALPDVADPYLYILKGFASLTRKDWSESSDYFRSAQEYFPERAQGLLDTLISEVDRTADLRYYRTWKRSFLNLLPGGGLFYLGNKAEAAGYALSAGTMALGAVSVTNWTRYLMGAGAGVLYIWSYWAAGRDMDAGNAQILDEHLASIRQNYSIGMFWRFAHPSIF